MYLARIYVSLKRTVNDPQGLTIKGALHNLGFDSVKNVRAGKFIEVWLDESDRASAEKKVREMCRQLLANPVIEDFSFDLSKAEQA